MKRHDLKILTPYFSAQLAGIMTVEVRKNDPGFASGDEIRLNEISGNLVAPGKPTGRSCLVRITCILRSEPGHEFAGIAPGYCVLGTELVHEGVSAK
jgi:hypothetical protein